MYNNPWYWVKDYGKYRGTFRITFKVWLKIKWRNLEKKTKGRVQVKVFLVFKDGSIKVQDDFYILLLYFSIFTVGEAHATCGK